MLVENLSYGAANEAYTLITAYIREEKIAADYNKEELAEFAKFLASILKHPGNFVTHLEEEEGE